MELRMNGWTGLVAAAVGLSVVGAALLSGGHESANEAPESGMKPIVLDAAPAGSPSSAPLANAGPAAPSPAVQPAIAAPATGQSLATAKPLVIKRILPISGPIRYGAWHWDEAGAPASGPLVITVDLGARVLSVFRDGYEIAATAVLLGTQEKPTPTGVFPISEKDADHESTIYTGAPMPYMMRLTNDGISIHGTEVENGYASHGCVGVPTPFAKKLFGIAAMGTPVYITRGKMAKLGDSLTG